MSAVVAHLPSLADVGFPRKDANVSASAPVVIGLPVAPDVHHGPNGVAHPSPAVATAPARTTCVNCNTTETPLWRRTAEGSPICNACGLYQKSRNAPRPASLSPHNNQPQPAQQQPPAHGHGGTCPGDGRCDGTGGASACNGCPTWNNRLNESSNDDTQQQPGSMRSLLNPTPSPASSGRNATPADSPQQQQQQVKINALSCGNCGTSTTPLWRRDDVGNNICNACGLYFKLHGTHRPTSMKKTVIKRRKRVPAAGGNNVVNAAAGHGGDNAMSDQAAAEALVAVGRSRLASSPRPHPTDEDGEDAPKRKRARRKAPAPVPIDEVDAKDLGKRTWFASPAPNGPSSFELPSIGSAFPGYMRGGSASGSATPNRKASPGTMGGLYSLPPVRSYHDGSNTSGTPTLEELERHYFSLHEQRRKMEELLRETERLMGGVRRGIDEMRGVTMESSARTEPVNAPSPGAMSSHSQASGSNGVTVNGNGNGSVNGSAPVAEPLPLRERAPSNERANVWPVNGAGSNHASPVAEEGPVVVRVD